MFRSALALALLSFAHSASANPCDQGFLVKQGAVMEMTRFDAQKKPMGKIVTTIVSSTQNGDQVTAVATLDNYVGANKASTNTLDFTCDGKNAYVKVRNDDAMKEVFTRAAAAGGNKVLGVTTLSDPQVYPLTLAVGAELPMYRSYSMTVAQKPPPDWGKVAMTGHWEQALAYALDNKVAAGMQIVTRHIKVLGQETCALPGGASTPCWHISKELFSKVVLGKGEITEDVDKLAKGAVVQQIHEWFAPGIGVTRLEIGPAGRPIVSMSLTQLNGR